MLLQTTIADYKTGRSVSEMLSKITLLAFVWGACVYMGRVRLYGPRAFIWAACVYMGRVRCFA
jgi:hypothetical protein